MLLRILPLFFLFSLGYSLDCFTCGVFLSAPTNACRGTPHNNTCHPDNLGCLTLTGKNVDGTYYVEKRCAEKDDDLQEGCIEIGLRGIRVQQCLCKDDLCNSVSPLTLSFSILLPLGIFILHSL